MTDLLNSLAAKIEFGDCWNWTAALRPGRGSTYGVVHVPGMSRNSRMRQAHRVLWEEVVGEIPEGMELDHLCRNGLCVNPDHLELVSPGENKRRGGGFAGINYRKTHCVNGHAFDAVNTHVDYRGYRKCRACDREHKRRRDARADRIEQGGQP